MDKVVLLSLASDLKRITLSIQRNSSSSTKRFNEEAKKWLLESKKTSDIKIKELLKKVEISLRQKDNLKKAEDLLMYSTLIQNKAISST